MYNLNQYEHLPNAGRLRQLAALLYDMLLVIALWLLATVPFMLIWGNTDRVWWLRLLFQTYLLAIAFGFLGWFWVNGGQTLGMRAWRLALVAETPPLNWRKAATRFLAALLSWACFGLGFLWIAFDREHRAWHDHLSGTRLVLTAKPRRGSPGAPQHDQRETEKDERRQARPDRWGDTVQQTEKTEAPVQDVKRESEHDPDK